jgi:putative zinc finger/helix-turn-helix YgiT family protein
MIDSIAKTTCPFCSSNEVAEHAHVEIFSIGRKRYSVPGILSTECAVCGEEFTTALQHDQNLAKKAEFTEKVPGFLTAGFVRKLREKFGLSQRLASKIFGAGQSSVAKWESGQVPSGPAALLLQCSAHVPGVMEFLASLASVEIEDCPDEVMWTAPVRSTKPKLAVFMNRARHAPEVPKSMYVSSGGHVNCNYSFEEINGMAA